MNKNWGIVGGIVGLILIAIAVYFLWIKKGEEPEPPPPSGTFSVISAEFNGG